jgi:hypothetical protein
VGTLLRNGSTAACRSAILTGTGGTKAAFFCLLFFAAAKKSRCCPAQGRRLKYRYEYAEATAAKGKKAKRQRMATGVADIKKPSRIQTKNRRKPDHYELSV